MNTQDIIKGTRLAGQITAECRRANLARESFSRYFMSFGFNSQLRIGDWLYHVQTEDRGPSHLLIDTVVFSQGRVLHRCSTSYQDLLGNGIADQDALRARVEQQHGDVLEALRSGLVPLQKSAPATATALGIRLGNAASWLVAGQVCLEIQVFSRADGQTLAGAEVEVTVDGAAAKSVFEARTDVDGRALVHFPLPPLAEPEAAVLVIRARLGNSQDQLRYHLKPKPHNATISSP